MFLMISFLTFVSLVVLFLLPNCRKKEPIHPPPGPKGLPFIGNLLQFSTSEPHIYFTQLAKTYGPIVGMRLGRVPVVVVHTAELAREVLHTQDLNFCSRPSMTGFRKLSFDGLDIAFAPYGDDHLKKKKISMVNLLNTKRVEYFAPIRKEEVSRLIKRVSSLSSSSKIVNMSELVAGYARMNICRIGFGKRFKDSDGSSERFLKLLTDTEHVFTAFFYGDYFPSIFGLIDKLNGQSSKLERTFNALDDFYQEIINEHLDPNRRQSEREDIVDVLLQLVKDGSFPGLDHVKAVLMNVFLAGSNTGIATLIWAMTELVKHPNAMKKVQEEVRNVMRQKGCINESDLKELEYFQAVVKETFRLHPATPLLIVREAIRKCTIKGFDILPKSLVYVNAWAIGRDPHIWQDPEKFMPERFLGSSIDFKGYNFELIPFGAGRRMCPGMNLGVANLELPLAHLLCLFDWDVPHGLNKEDIDTETLPGITMHKKIPLCLLAIKYDGFLT